MERAHPNVTHRQISPNQSSRNGQSIRLIVIHCTESPDNGDDVGAVANYFSSSSSQVSAHVITDDEGRSARCVDDGGKAWHVAGYNGAALGIEQIGYTFFTSGKWSEESEGLLKETARWVALWSREYNIPIGKAGVGNGRVWRKGIARHSDLGSVGGNHGDPGPGYPMGRMFQWARYFKEHHHHG